MSKALRNLLTVLGIFALGVVARPLIASYVDPVLDAGRIRVFSNGIQKFDMMTNPAADDSFRVHNAVSDNFVVVVDTNDRVDMAASSGLRLPVLTTTAIQAKIPKYVGELIWNSTLGKVCVSTGAATVEAYGLASNQATTCQ